MKKLSSFLFLIFSVFCTAQENNKCDSLEICREDISDLYTDAILYTLSNDYFRGRDIRDKKIEEVREYIVSVVKNNNFKPIQDSSFLYEFEIQQGLNSKFILAKYIGDPSTSKATLLVANYDNIGVFQKNSYSDSIYNGANDNASGVTALIQTAIYLSKNKLPKNIILAFTSGRRFGYSGHAILVDKLLENDIRLENVFRFIRLAQPVSLNLQSVFIHGSKNNKLISDFINLSLDEKYLLPIDELNGMKEFEQPFHSLMENLTGAECYTFTTFNYTNDPQFFTPEDDIDHIDLNYFHESLRKLSYGMYELLNNN